MSDTAWPGPRGNYYDPAPTPFPFTKPIIQAFETPVLIKTVSYQLLNSDCGATISNEGATGTVTVTLPAIGFGFWFSFAVMTAQSLTIKAPANVFIRNAASLSAAAGTCAASTIGNSITLIAINNNTWVSFGAVGTWTIT